MSGTSVSRAVPVEQVVSLNPFVVRRRIAFRDCDPAGIVYTPRFLDPIATSAVDLFMGELIGMHGNRDAEMQGVDTPAKAVNLVFYSRVAFGDTVDLEVHCSNIGRTTFEITVSGRSLEGELHFETSLTTICVEREPVYRARPVPEYLKTKLEPYRQFGNT